MTGRVLYGPGRSCTVPFQSAVTNDVERKIEKNDLNAAEGRGPQNGQRDWNTSLQALKPSIEQNFACLELFRNLVKICKNVTHVFFGVYMFYTVRVSVKNLMKHWNADSLSFSKYRKTSLAPFSIVCKLGLLSAS